MRCSFSACITLDPKLTKLDLIRLIPVMTCRIITSLKKASVKTQKIRDLEVSNGIWTDAGALRSPRRVEDIRLSSLSSGER